MSKKNVKFDQEAAFRAIIGQGAAPIEGQITVDEIQGSSADLPKAELQQPVTAETEAAVTKKKGRPKMQRETKKRISYTILPSLHEKASEIAYREGKNMSELISEFLAEYVEKNQ